jgi:branched-chain amino acid transport system ATP-binding protein
MVLLEIDGLHKSFGGLTATDNVSFRIMENEIIGLIGPNGAGKTTLFNLISGALTPDKGTIAFKDNIISGLKPHQICRLGIARTFQLVNLFEHMSAFENVFMAARFGSLEKKGKAAAATLSKSLLEFVDLAGRADIAAGDLAVADQKRLEIARALATGPQLLLLDEVMAGLNPAEVNQAVELVRKIRDRRITILMIEHVMKAIMGISDRVVALHFGKKIAEGTPQQVADDPTVLEVYLGLDIDAES